MAFEKIKKTLIKMETRIFKDYKLAFFKEAIVCWWNPYSISPEPVKTYWRCTNILLRFHSDGNVTIESLEHSYYIPKHLALQLAREDFPFYHVEYADVFDSKLERDLAKKPLVPIPEKIEVEGAILPYGKPILQSLIAEVMDKFGKGKATETEILDYLTEKPPHGGGWLNRTPTLIEKVKTTLTLMFHRGILAYNEETLEYTLIEKPTTSKLRRSLN